VVFFFGGLIAWMWLLVIQQTIRAARWHLRRTVARAGCGLSRIRRHILERFDFSADPAVSLKSSSRFILLSQTANMISHAPLLVSDWGILNRCSR